MKQTVKISLKTWHRRIGAIILLAFVCWCLSGLLHPIMSRLRPEPATRAAMVEPLDTARVSSLAEVLRQHNIPEADKARLFSYQQQPVYRLEQNQQVHFFPAETNSENRKAPFATDQDYAIALARHYSGDNNSAVSSVTVVTRFDYEYAFINRLLPVYKVTFKRDDGLRVFVETQSGRLGRITDNTSATLSWLFTRLHSWKFISNDNLRHSLLLIFISLGLITSIAGVVLYLSPAMGRSAKPGMPQWHRRLGAVVAVAAIGFTSSGLIRLLPMDSPPLPDSPNPLSASPEQLEAEWSWLKLHDFSLMEAELVAFNNSHWFRLVMQRAIAPASRPETKVVYFNTRNGDLSDKAEQEHARALALYYSGLPPQTLSSVKPIHRFDHEYGFINKRLPVYRAQFVSEDNRTLYVETRSGVLASDVSDSDRLRGYSFAWLHKWRFLDGLGKTARDGIQMVAILALLLVSLSGGWLYWRRLKRK